MTTNVPAPTFGANGFVAPTESVILAGVTADINAAFGGGLNPALTTPQGQLASSEAAIIGDTDATFVFITNQMDPAFSQGRFQDGIARIYFLERDPAEPTVVQALCTGLAGTVIPTGAQAVAADGNLYICTGGGTIPVGGSITLSFECAVTGPIACPAGTLTTIYQAITGWDSITNPSDGVLGTNVESRSAFEARRAASVAGNSFGAIGSIIGAVAKVGGVLDFYGYNNGTNAPVTITGTTIGANSIYICVVGGADADVAQAILSKKGPGASATGNTSVTAYDNNPLYSAPIPYTITFERPPALQILFAVNIVNGAQVPANAVAQIQNAIINAFAGGDGGPRARIGSTIFATRFIGPIAALGPWAQVISLQIGSANTPSAVVTGSIGATFTGTGSGTNLTTTSVTGLISVGDTVLGAGVPPNTTIVSQTSGTTGGAGVYVTSNATTSSSAALSCTSSVLKVTAVASGTLAVGQTLISGTSLLTGTVISALITGSGSTGTYRLGVAQRFASGTIDAVLANANSVVVGIAQAPTVAAANIAVTLT